MPLVLGFGSQAVCTDMVKAGDVKKLPKVSASSTIGDLLPTPA